MSLWQKTDPKSIQKALNKIAKLGNMCQLFHSEAIAVGGSKNAKGNSLLNQLDKECAKLAKIASTAASVEVACAAIDALHISTYYTNNDLLKSIAIESPQPAVRDYALKQLGTVSLYDLLKTTNDPQLFAATLDEITSENNLGTMTIAYYLGSNPNSNYGKELIQMMQENPAKFRPYWHKVSAFLDRIVTKHEDANRHGDTNHSSDCHHDSTYHVDTPAGNKVFRIPPYPFDD